MDLDLTVRYLDDLTALNVTLPANAARAADTYRAALAAAGQAPASDLHAALVGGTLTPDNIGQMVTDAALRQAASKNAHEVVNALRTTFNKVIRDALRTDRDRLITELRGQFRPAAEGIAKAAQHFGPGTTSDQVISAPAEVIAAWNATASQAATLDAVSSAYRSLLNDVTGELPTSEEMVSLFITGKALDVDHAASLYRGPDKWLSLAHAGFKLRLNSPEDARAVVVSAAEIKAKQAEAERAQRLSTHRRQHMPLGIR